MLSILFSPTASIIKKTLLYAHNPNGQLIIYIGLFEALFQQKTMAQNNHRTAHAAQLSAYHALASEQ
jgi:hypothetical protein